MKHNYEIILEIKDDLNNEDKNFINSKIEFLKNKFGIEQNENVFFRNEKNISYDDVPYCLSFCLHISKFRSYFKKACYNSFAEGVINGEL